MKTVLYIDDNDEILDIVRLSMANSGYRVLTENDSSKAVDRCIKELPELVLMDISMPGLNGFEITRNLRKAGFNKPVVVLTASESEEDRKRAKAAGCTDYILKTVDMRNVGAIVDHYIGEMGQLIS